MCESYYFPNFFSQVEKNGIFWVLRWIYLWHTWYFIHVLIIENHFQSIMHTININVDINSVAVIR